MTLRQGLVRFVVATAPLVFFPVAMQSPAQPQDENANSTTPLFKAISVKPTKSGIQGDRGAKSSPGEVTVTNLTTQELIQGAYDVNDDQVLGAPSWLNSQRYDIEAKADNPAAEQDDEHWLERGLLTNTFKLAVHRETRLIPTYELTVGDGSKLRAITCNDEFINWNQSGFTVNRQLEVVGQKSLKHALAAFPCRRVVCLGFNVVSLRVQPARYS